MPRKQGVRTRRLQVSKNDRFPTVRRGHMPGVLVDAIALVSRGSDLCVLFKSGGVWRQACREYGLIMPGGGLVDHEVWPLGLRQAPVVKR